MKQAMVTESSPFSEMPVRRPIRPRRADSRFRRAISATPPRLPSRFRSAMERRFPARRGGLRWLDLSGCREPSKRIWYAEGRLP